MNISSRAIESSQVVLEIEIDAARVELALDRAYRRAVARLKVPGFRPGRAPRPLVERMIGRETLLEDAIEHLVPTVYAEAVDQARLRPIDDAAFEVLETDPLRIKATVPVRPQVELGDYRALRRTLDVPTISDEQVDEVIQQLRDSHATWMPVDRPVQAEDRVAMDVRGTVGERVLIDRQDTEHVVRLGQPVPVPGFGEQLLAMAPGDERAFTIRLPGDFGERSLVGQDAEFSVKIHGVKEKLLPELDDAFASTVGAFATADELRKQVRDELRARAETTARLELQQAVIDAVVDQATLELPPQAIARRAARVREELTAALDKQGITVEQYRQLAGKNASDLDREMETTARRELTRQFVLEAVADAEEIGVDDAEIEAEIRGALADRPDSQRSVRAALGRPEARQRVGAGLRERKAVDRLVALATDQVDGAPEAGLPVGSSAEERSHA